MTADLVARLRATPERCAAGRAQALEAADAIDSLTAELDLALQTITDVTRTLLDRLAAADADSKLCADSYGRCRERLEAAERALEQIGNLVGGPTMTYSGIHEIREWRNRAQRIHNLVANTLEASVDPKTSEIVSDIAISRKNREGEEMCPNCVTPWKCNGPHEVVTAKPEHTNPTDLNFSDRGKEGG